MSVNDRNDWDMLDFVWSGERRQRFEPEGLCIAIVLAIPPSSVNKDSFVVKKRFKEDDAREEIRTNGEDDFFLRS